MEAISGIGYLSIDIKPSGTLHKCKITKADQNREAEMASNVRTPVPSGYFIYKPLRHTNTRW
jgi:hypothetical protein